MDYEKYQITLFRNSFGKWSVSSFDLTNDQFSTSGETAHEAMTKFIETWPQTLSAWIQLQRSQP